MYKFKTVSVVIPCYNEQEGLDEMLRCKPLFIDEVIVVDNNSNDGTRYIAKKYGTTIVHERKRGYGQACLAGLSKANGDIIVVLDGDNSYPLTEIKRLLSHMENENHDFVTGRRYPLVNKKAQSAVHKVANQSISWLIRSLFKINLKDSQSGMMAFKKNLLDKIEIFNTGMGFSQEIKIKAFIKSNIRCGEVHISYVSRVGKVKFRRIQDSLKNLHSVLCLWRESIDSETA